MSNGSEPERCVHAVDGPDWAGLRELSSWKERALAAEDENASLRENRMKERAALVARIDDYKGERDALRAQLAEMTVEHRLRRVGVNEKGRVTLVEPYYEQRLVSSWTVVEGGAEMSETSSGAAKIAAERERQATEEGWTAEHDKGRAGQLALAAESYALAAADDLGVLSYIANDPDDPPMDWPWGAAYWKPTGDPVRDLVKAGALIAAAIDSLEGGS